MLYTDVVHLSCEEVSATPRVTRGYVPEKGAYPDADQPPWLLLMRWRPGSCSLGAPKVGPWDGFSSPKRFNPAVKQVHGEAEPVHPGRARLLLKTGRAVVFKRFPFTLLLKYPGEHNLDEPFRLKIDPGSRTTGLALIGETSGEVVWAGELAHQGEEIVERLRKRRAARRGRRQRHTRYRQARFENRRRSKGWLPPSQRSRVQNVVTWVGRLRRLCPITALSMELVRFDTQAMQTPDIEGLQYQQGTLAGYETKEYVLEKWGQRCAYCDATGVPLEVEHIRPRSRGGSNRESNLTLSCVPCNKAKGIQDIRVFLEHAPQRLANILSQAKAPLRDVAAVHATRWTLYERLVALGLPVEVGSGGHRSRQGLPKTHWTDAACTGASTPQEVRNWQTVHPLLITATGRQRRQMCNVDKRGFPRGKPKGPSRSHGLRTGDMVRAVVTKGRHMGTYVGRVAIKSDGYFKLTTGARVVEGIHARYCTPLHRGDGYAYAFGNLAALPPHV
jgi:5-methylcytosine-specific restriction endonuclease McrA